MPQEPPIAVRAQVLLPGSSEVRVYDGYKPWDEAAATDRDKDVRGERLHLRHAARDGARNLRVAKVAASIRGERPLGLGRWLCFTGRLVLFAHSLLAGSGGHFWVARSGCTQTCAVDRCLGFASPSLDTVLPGSRPGHTLGLGAYIRREPYEP